MKIEKQNHKNVVLVGVLKDHRDLDILKTKHWYRIPLEYFPTHKFSYIAFYQPEIFDKNGKRINFYAKVLRFKTKKRIELLPKEQNHQNSNKLYKQIFVGEIKKINNPIRNIFPRRVSFGFTTLNLLKNSKDILQVYNVIPTEQIIEEALNKIKIKTIPQYWITIDKKKFRIDLVIFSKTRKIAIECDNTKAHSRKIQRQKDKTKDEALKKDGWNVIRLSEKEILSDLNSCIFKIKRMLRV
ncbi:MAG: DUF559 domain-containing protein [Candidatus Paceibacterota bacterium]|jgi:very-short-patch-repair endonuclease